MHRGRIKVYTYTIIDILPLEAYNINVKAKHSKGCDAKL